MVIKEKESQANSQTFLLGINEMCLEALKKADYKVWFGVRNAVVKVDNDLDQVGAATDLSKKIKIDGPTGANEPHTQSDHVDDNADKSASLEMRLD